MLIKRNQDWLSAPVGDELLMMSLKQGKYVGLNEVGARIWDLIATPMTFEDICSALVVEFEVSAEECAAAVTAFLGDLDEAGVIVRA